jgi:hypothetical protein
LRCPERRFQENWSPGQVKDQGCLLAQCPQHHPMRHPAQRDRFDRGLRSLFRQRHSQ